METYIYWFLLALILLGLEMATGTFYLLALAIAMAVGGISALLTLSLVWQLLLCALTMIICTQILRRWKASRINESENTSFDIGQPVKIVSWHENATARVLYRGAEWDAELDAADVPRDGVFIIKAVHGATLVLTQRKQPNN
jgi:membrane protein implicated in regulation of membrane protease activity